MAAPEARPYRVHQRVFGTLGPRESVYALDAALAPGGAAVAVPLSSGEVKLYAAGDLAYVGGLEGEARRRAASDEGLALSPSPNPKPTPNSTQPARASCGG